MSYISKSINLEVITFIIAQMDDEFVYFKTAVQHFSYQSKKTYLLFRQIDILETFAHTL